MAKMTDADKEEWAVKTVVALQGDATLRQQFMTVYHSNDNKQIHDFLTGKIGMPDELATTISQGKGKALSDYIGQLVCDYLW